MAEERGPFILDTNRTQKVITFASTDMICVKLNPRLSIVVLMIAVGLGGCVPRFSDPDISMIALRGQSGLLGQSFRIEFRRDGKARFECGFYNLNADNKHEKMRDPICDDLYREFAPSFKLDDDRLKGEFTGSISAEKFAELSKTLIDNGYFSMRNGWDFDGRTDSPPDLVEVEFDGTKKEIGDRDAKKDHRFSAIKSSIYALGETTKWERK